jgi:hypothetical protein
MKAWARNVPNLLMLQEGRREQQGGRGFSRMVLRVTWQSKPKLRMLIEGSELLGTMV